MMKSKRSKELHTKQISELLHDIGFRDSFELEPVFPDGSERVFFRVNRSSKQSCIAVFANVEVASSMLEANAVHKIGSHLYNSNVAVPEILAFSPDHGLVLMEDLGDRRLFDVLTESPAFKRNDYGDLIHWYQKCIDILIKMQTGGIQGFDQSWCCDTKRYDVDLMLTRESGYFLSAYIVGFLSLPVPLSLTEEFKDIAEHAIGNEKEFFFHRDFQSRNIMVTENGRLSVIDFQGGRVGPSGYDLASLLIDPYIGLSEEIQCGLVDYYCIQAVNRTVFDEYQWKIQYEFLALQRNLQILGAFAFLTKVKKKTFFAPFIVKALELLNNRLEREVFKEYTSLKALVQKAWGHTV